MFSTDLSDIPGPILRPRSHSALKTINIIDKILLKLSEDPLATKADLVSMAQCCRAFEDPSLNHLWASMSSVVPLLKLIHGVEEFQGSLARIPFRKITHEDLSPRFHSYAKHIRNINYDVSGDFNQVDTSTWMRLARLDSALLPNLKSFKLSYLNPSTLGRERSLLLLPALIRRGPVVSFSFKTTSVVSYRARYEVGPILTLLSDYNLGIEVLEAAGTFTARYSQVLRTVQTLQSVSLELSLDSPLPDILTTLSSLPNLRKLGLVFFGITPDPDHLKSYLFPKLVGIVLRGRITFISRTLASVNVIGLECVDVQVMPGAGDGVQDSVSSSLQLSRFPALRKISVDLVGCDPSHRYEDRDNKLSFVAPMLGNQRVEELVITSLESTMCLSDYEVIQLATAWPLLRILRLEHTSPPVMQPSFASLATLAARCPRMTQLSISLREDHLRDVTRKWKLRPIMGALNLQHTKITQYVRAARYISGLFPLLHNFDMSEQRAGETMHNIMFRGDEIEDVEKVDDVHLKEVPKVEIEPPESSPRKMKKKGKK
ncbi:hypothetical protein BDZ94DRAFT_1326583 [Collybia nuda]|uniref:F-box domain-containing protein n=1 Tax=Collybia nuda TaxID=64659 RepID=A0A9P5XUD4_9AGAR|nr:hypothetical protein BDZ94DRAFT_1326583 [Collybia nuda]